MWLEEFKMDLFVLGLHFNQTTDCEASVTGWTPHGWGALDQMFSVSADGQHCPSKAHLHISTQRAVYPAAEYPFLKTNGNAERANKSRHNLDTSQDTRCVLHKTSSRMLTCNFQTL